MKIERQDEPHGKLYGELAIRDVIIRDVTKPVVLDVEYAGMATSQWGTVSAGFSFQRIATVDPRLLPKG
jgi:polyisoprenoid-binding protein YceI